MSTRAVRLFRSEPKPRRSATPPPPEPIEEKPPTALWKTLTGETERRCRPVPVTPETVELWGYAKAALLTQLDFWMERATYKDQNGRKWIFNTLSEWRACTGLSESTIKRQWQELKALGVVDIEQFHVSRLRRENFYSLNYQNMERCRPAFAKVADELDTLNETTKTRRRFSGGVQPLINGRFNVE